MSSIPSAVRAGGIRSLRLWVTARPFTVATYGLSSLTVAMGLFLADFDLTSAAACLAILWGWCEVDGLCGRSHVCTITPVSLTSRSWWAKVAAAYTLGGLATSMAVGSAIGFVGTLLSLDELPAARWTGLSTAILAVVLAIRGMGLASFRLPQIHCQTHKGWAMDFGMVTGATMWGAHIGLGAATVIQHGGLYVLAALSAADGPARGALLFAAFWIGRTLPIWFSGTLTANDRDASRLTEVLFSRRSAYRHGASIGFLCAALLLWIAA